MFIRDLVESTILSESPLPPDWDKDIYDPRVPFKTRIEYAKERAQQVGRGSSRVAFKVPYQGRPTVIKIASNRKGMAQNKAEIEMMEDWFVKGLDIVVPMIDYDERSSNPTWIHMEYAPKPTPSQMRKALAGADIGVVIAYLTEFHRGRRPMDILSDETKETAMFEALNDLGGSFSVTLLPDLSRLANWGMHRGVPKIVDIGYTDATKHLYS